MPNGGEHHCGYCRWNKANRCTLRNFEIELPYWTTCKNLFSEESNPIGLVYAIVCEVKNGAGQYGEIPYFEGIRVDTYQTEDGGDTVVRFTDSHGKKHQFVSIMEYLNFYHQHAIVVKPSWDHLSWRQKFRTRSSDPDHYRALRRKVYKNTVEICNAGAYLTASGAEVNIDMDLIHRAAKESVFYPNTRVMANQQIALANDTKFFAIEADCLETARLLQLSGYKPAVLNMASNSSPGGGVLGGSGAQEENLFRRSTAFTSLYQYIDSPSEFWVERNPEHSYPIPRESGGIYSPGIFVFRSSESTGYYLLEHPYSISLISVAAIANPPLVMTDGKARIKDQFIEATREKIRAILRIGIRHEQDSLVLSAFGCGAFANPPEHMAELFGEVFNEPEFRGAYKMIVFAIIEDHNSSRPHNPMGNVIPFQDWFN